jgi:pantetheine-phosphate adenylyltransferase
MTRVLYPGTFDPPTNGHVNIIKRAKNIFDHIDIVIAENIEKTYLFSAQERYEMLESIVSDMENIKIHIWNGLIVDFAAKHNIKIIMRGIRALSDFNHEFELSIINKALNPDIDTILLPTDEKYFVLRSSTIKELAKFKGDISKMVPPVVLKYINEKYK